MDVSDIFSFFCSGERKGKWEAPGRGWSVLPLRIPGGGGVFQERGGPEGPGGCLRGNGRGGGSIFLSGPKFPQGRNNLREFFSVIEGLITSPHGVACVPSRDRQ